jgi:hypothetical protein
VRVLRGGMGGVVVGVMGVLNESVDV